MLRMEFMGRRWTKRMTRRMTRTAGAAQVIEPELDMSRPDPRPPAFLQNLSRLLRWLTPESRATRAPMRSVARELEEVFPAGDH